MLDLDAEVTAAVDAHRHRRFDDALERYERILSKPGHDMSLHYLVARVWENGDSMRGVNYQQALYHYKLLDDEAETFGSVGAVGCARTLSKQDRCANRELIEAYCKKAIELDGSIAGVFLLGQLYEICDGNHRLARRHYMRMLRSGRPWGLRYFARSHMAYGSLAMGVLAHIITTIISPVYFLANRGGITPEFDR